MPPSSYDEAIEGRVLSDEEVLRMERKEKMDANTRAVIKEQDSLNRERFLNIRTYESKGYTFTEYL